MRSFKRGASAATLARSHALIRNRRGGFSPLTARVTPNLRLATASPQLMPAISRRGRPPAAACRRPVPQLQTRLYRLPIQRQQNPRPYAGRLSVTTMSGRVRRRAMALLKKASTAHLRADLN